MEAVEKAPDPPSEGPGDEAPPSSDVEQSEPASEQGGADVPMTKSRMKKLARLERMKAAREAKRAAEKAAKVAHQAARREELAARLAAMTEEEKAALRDAHQASRAGRRADTAARKEKLAASLVGGVPLVLDLDFNEEMNDNDMRHLCQQLMYSYSANIRSPRPCHLHLVSLKGRLREMAGGLISGFANWQVTRTEASFDEHFKECKDRLVYLTADSENEIEEVDPDKIYIIGGLVDHNRHKGICQQRAVQAGVATARLPISRYVTLESRAVLTVNQVVAIMVEMHNRHDWQAVLDEVLPPRKRAGYRAAKEAHTAAKQAAKQQQKEQQQGQAEGQQEGEQQEGQQEQEAHQAGQPSEGAGGQQVAGEHDSLAGKKRSASELEAAQET